MGKELKKRAEKAFELLRDSGQILFLPQILEILSGYSQSEQEKKEYGFLRESILEVGEKYGVHYEKMPLFRYCNRMFELDYEVIKRTRDAMELSQESLCGDICTQETLSRIERGKNAPAFGTMQQLMQKMDRKWKQIAMVITAERYEALVVEREVVKSESRREEKCQEEFEKLGELLDMDVLENQQYVELKKLMFEMRNQKYSYEEAIQKLYDILYLTLKCRGDEMYQYPLMFREVLVLNLIAVYHCWNQEIEKGVQMWKKLLKNFEQKKVDKVFLSREWELIAGNMAQRIAELGKEEQGIRICQERLKMQLEMGKGAHIGRSLEIMAYALDKLQNQNYIYYFRNAMHWFRLMKHDSRYLLMKEYAEENQLELYS